LFCTLFKFEQRAFFLTDFLTTNGYMKPIHFQFLFVLFPRELRKLIFLKIHVSLILMKIRKQNNCFQIIEFPIIIILHHLIELNKWNNFPVGGVPPSLIAQNLHSIFKKDAVAAPNLQLCLIHLIVLNKWNNSPVGGVPPSSFGSKLWIIF
jgi:hypothetical protein